MAADAYATPKEAAFAEWSRYPLVQVWVVRVELTDTDNAVVVTDTEPSRPMRNCCRRTPVDWVFVGDSN